jgi:hypothetical protein
MQHALVMEPRPNGSPFSFAGASARLPSRPKTAVSTQDRPSGLRHAGSPCRSCGRRSRRRWCSGHVPCGACRRLPLDQRDSRSNVLIHDDGIYFHGKPAVINGIYCGRRHLWRADVEWYRGLLYSAEIAGAGVRRAVYNFQSEAEEHPPLTNHSKATIPIGN